MMGTPQFVTLAQVDKQRYIAACRHGVVHLTWGRATLRLSQDEFQLLVVLIERATHPETVPAPAEGPLQVTFRPDANSEVQMRSRTGSWVLLLVPAGFQDFLHAVRNAAQQLEEILASGVWDVAGSDEDEMPPDPLQRLKRSHFSRN